MNVRYARSSSTDGLFGNGFVVLWQLASRFACFYVVSARYAAAFAGMAGNVSLLAYGRNSRAFSPRLVALPQLPSRKSWS